MKLTLDCPLTHQLSALQSNSALARLLSVAKITQSELPLEALVCQQYGLQLQPDYPIAAIAAVADGLNVGDAYWLRADPVHLILQRDCFSLHETVPLSIEHEHAGLMIESLNQHFRQDGLVFYVGQSGAWYLRSEQVLEIQTTLPSVAAGKNIHQFLPQGAGAARCRAVLNEVQMILHEHPVNMARESIGELAVNSVWFSGGGALPANTPINDAQPISSAQSGTSVIVATSAFYQGMAHRLGLPLQAVPENPDSFLLGDIQSRECVRLQLPELENVDDVWFKALLTAIKRGKINQLILNLGFYEKSLIVKIKPADLYLKFWRRPKPVMHYLT